MNSEQVKEKINEHLVEMDKQLDLMVCEDYSHESIHNFRESIRRFRAFLFLIKPLLSTKTYQSLEKSSKHNFDRTSLIREIDVFEHGYGYYMRRSTLEKLSEAVKPLINTIRKEGRQAEFNRFSSYTVHLKSMTDSVLDKLIQTQYAILVESFMQAPENDNEEKAIHSKRMYVKKIKYINEMMRTNDPKFEAINRCLDQFQDTAKKLHDVCVNLRFIGQYQLEDSALLERLIRDHGVYQKASETQYALVRETMKKALTESEDV